MTKHLQLSDYDAILHDTLAKCEADGAKVGDLEEFDFFILLAEEDGLLRRYYPNLPPSGIRPRNGCIGYPVTPSLYKNIANVFYEWVNTSICPVRQLPYFEAFDDKEYRHQFSLTEKQVLEMLKGLESLWDLWNKEERMYRIQLILACLNRRGILTLLGIRKTVGSVDRWPPPLSQLIFAFDAPISSEAALSEGARAISKHYIRDNTLQFWGQCKGNDMQKSTEARAKLLELVDTAVWINIHELPGHLPVIEIRQENGYGARWLADASSFRGLLEPHMVDGHAVGWKH